MAALVQSYPQQSSTVTMLQTRPSSASGIIHAAPQTHQYPTNPQNMQRNSYHGLNGSGVNVSTYRGQTTMTPIAPYAFTSTPNLTTPGQRPQNGPHLRLDQRTSSAPSIHDAKTPRSRYPAPPSVSTTSSSSSSDLSSLGQKSGSKDDSVVLGTARVVSGAARPTIAPSISTQSIATPTNSSPVKAVPDRYRRPNNRRAETSPNTQTSSQTVNSSGASMPNVMQFYGSSVQQAAAPGSYQDLNTQPPQVIKNASGFTTSFGSVDDMQLSNKSGVDPAKRYRRRSIHTIDAAEFGGVSTSLLQQGSRQVSSAHGRIDQQQQQHPLRSSPVVMARPSSSHGRNVSNDSVNSARSRSRPSSVNSPFLTLHRMLRIFAYPTQVPLSNPIKANFALVSLIR